MEQSGGWGQYTSQDNRVYYYNSQTNESRWEKPEALMTEGERLLLKCPWREYLSSSGKKYYFNKETKVSLWEEPAELKELREQLKRQENLQANEKTPPPPTLTKTEAREKIRGLFNELNLPNVTGVGFDYIAQKVAHDARWHCLKNVQEKRQLWSEYKAERVKHDKENWQRQLVRDRQRYSALLNSTPELHVNSKWRLAQLLTKKTEVYQAIYTKSGSEAELERLFHEFIQEKRDRLRDEETQRREQYYHCFLHFLKSNALGRITIKTTWEEVESRFAGHPEYTNAVAELGEYTPGRFDLYLDAKDHRHQQQQQKQQQQYWAYYIYQDPFYRVEMLNAYRTLMNSIQTEYYTELESKEAQMYIDACKARLKFTRFLEVLCAQKVIHVNLRFKDFYANFHESPIFSAFHKAPMTGSHPLDLYKIFMHELARRLDEDHKRLESVLQNVPEQERLQLQHSFDQFKHIIAQAAERTADRELAKNVANIDPGDMEILYDRMILRLMQREKEKILLDEKEKQLRVRAFRTYLKTKLDPLIRPDDHWADVQQNRLAHDPVYLDLINQYPNLVEPSDTTLQAVFDHVLHSLSKEEGEASTDDDGNDGDDNDGSIRGLPLKTF